MGGRGGVRLLFLLQLLVGVADSLFVLFLQVECKFAPPEVPGGDTEKVCVIVGQWVEVKYECVLKGGYTPPGVEDEEIVNVLLRGFVVQ